MEQKILETREEFNKLVEFVTGEAVGREIHEVEGELFRMLLRLGRVLLELFLSAVGTGNVGQTVTTAEGSVMEYRRDAPRQYLSIFGAITIVRAYYLKEGGKGIFPLESWLNLPKRKYSYLLQKWMTLSGVRTTYEGAVQWMEEIFGLELAHRPIQRVTHDLTPAVEEFNDTLERPEFKEEGPILIETLDRKGIPMCKPYSDQPRTADKPGKKKMAMVTATLSVDPYERAPAEEIVESLLHQGDKKPPRKKTRRAKHHHKRIIASLKQETATVMDKAQEAAMSRIHENTRLKAVVCDGEKSLWKAVDDRFPGWIQILDVMHVMDKLWFAAHIYHKEESPEAKDYVRERVLALLEGEVDDIIEDFTIALDDGSLSRSKAHALKHKVLGYFLTNRDRMKYDEYLAAGLPIGSGVIEGTCKNLINDRMERSGMRWSLKGAEAMLKLRAVYLSDLWNNFWDFRTQKEKKSLYEEQISIMKQPLYQDNVLKAA